MHLKIQMILNKVKDALIIDTLRKYINDIINYCLVPLLNKASIHTNTT